MFGSGNGNGNGNASRGNVTGPIIATACMLCKLGHHGRIRPPRQQASWVPGTTGVRPARPCGLPSLRACQHAESEREP
eukprot:366557-Chlamydomonas_euryale.AAC.12